MLKQDAVSGWCSRRVCIAECSSRRQFPDGASERCASLKCSSRTQFPDGASEGCASLECLSRRQFLMVLQKGVHRLSA